MNLRAELLQEHSKAQCSKIVAWVGRSQNRFDELVHLFFADEYRVVQRAAWAVSYCVEAHPPFFQPHFATLIKTLEQPAVPVAVKRNSVRLLQYVSIPYDFQGSVMDLCFQYIADPQEAAAVKAFSLTVLANLSLQYPEILPEIKTIVEERWNTETPSFRSRAKKLKL